MNATIMKFKCIKTFKTTYTKFNFDKIIINRLKTMKLLFNIIENVVI